MIRKGLFLPDMATTYGLPGPFYQAISQPKTLPSFLNTDFPLRYKKAIHSAGSRDQGFK
jgi:hypothetical protein